MSDTPFDAPAEDALAAQPHGVPEATPADELPSAIDLVSDSFKTFMDDIGPFALGGLGAFLAGLAAMVVIFSLGFGCLFGGVFGGMILVGGAGASGSEELAAGAGLLSTLIFLVSYLGMFLVIFLGTAIVTGPLNGSLMRAADVHLRGGPKVGFGSAFSTMTQQPVKDILAPMGLGLSIMLGLFVFYVGALFAVFFLHWWPFYVWLDGASPLEGAKRAFNHSKDNLTWHLGVFGLALAIGLVANYVPVLGPMFASIYQLKAYRAVYPRESADPDILI